MYSNISIYSKGLLTKKFTNVYVKVKTIIIILAILEALFEAVEHNNPHATRNITPTIKSLSVPTCWDNDNGIRINQ